jgi:hypothetical protein
VGNGFKVGVGAVWLASLAAPFSCSLVPGTGGLARQDRATVTTDIGSQENPGVISFTASELYLKADNFPTLRLESCEATCEFSSHVPIQFKTQRQQWKVGGGLKIQMHKMKSRMTTSGGLTTNPPQALVRFAVEQVLKLIITKNLKQFFPPEIGM